MLIQRRFDSVEPRNLIAQRTGKGGEHLWSTEAREQQIGGGVVTACDGGIAKLGDRHAAPPTCFSVTGAPIHEIVLRKDDAPLELLLLLIDAREHQGRRQSLECAAHQDALVGTVFEAFAGGQIEDRHADAAGMLAFQLGEAVPGSLARLRAHSCLEREQHLQAKHRSGKRLPARHH